MNTNSMKKQKDTTLKDEPPRSEGIKYATGEQRRAITNGSRRNEEAEPKWKRCLAVEVFGGQSQLPCCEEQPSQEPGMFGL